MEVVLRLTIDGSNLFERRRFDDGDPGRAANANLTALETIGA
jgi:hypothetical protein